MKTAKEIMSKEAECVAPETTISAAAERMRDRDIGFLPVCEDDRLVGAVTDRDITLRAVAQRRSLETPVRDIMTPQVFYCLEDDSLDKVAALMKEKEVHRIVVLDSDKRLTGVISIGDLSEADKKKAGDTYKDVFEAA